MSGLKPMDRKDVRRSEIMQYRDTLLRSDKYSTQRQLLLKRRVFNTFNALLNHRGFASLENGRSVLDLGSADSAFATVCEEAGLKARGLDINDGVDFESDALPIRDCSVDVVTATSLIEHLHSPKLMLEEALRALKPGGAIILVTPNIRYTGASFYDDPTHVHPYTEISLHRVLVNAGYFDPYVVPWLVNKPAWLWDAPAKYFIAHKLIPFRGDAGRFIPAFLKGRSGALLAIAGKRLADGKQTP